MAEYPALPLFTDAYMADTRHLNAAQHGAYLLLLMTAWRMPDCKLPDDDKFLARCAAMDLRTWKANRDIVMAFWRKDDKQKFYQGRLLDERKYVDEKRSKNSKAAKDRWLKENRSLDANAMPKECETHAPTPTPTPTPITTLLSETDFQKVFEFGYSLFPNLMTANTSEIHKWLQAGCSVEHDILPSIKRSQGKNVKSWNYFSGAIMDAKATREKPLPKGTAHETTRSTKSDESYSTEAERLAAKYAEEAERERQAAALIHAGPSLRLAEGLR